MMCIAMGKQYSVLVLGFCWLEIKLKPQVVVTELRSTVLASHCSRLYTVLA